MTLAELRTKEVIDVHDGKRLGRVMDIEFCTADSRVTALVVPAETSFLQTLRGEKCGLVIPWEDIQRIGDDVILVSTKCSCACRQDGTHWEEAPGCAHAPGFPRESEGAGRIAFHV